MKKLPDRFICEFCGFISTRDFLVCPACQNGGAFKIEGKEPSPKGLEE